MVNALDPNLFNSKILAEARKFKLDASVKAEGQIENGTGVLVQSIRQSTGKSNGEINKVGLKFARHGIYFEKGAGKGKGGNKGSRWRNPTGQLVTTKSSSFGKMNTGDRKAKPWIAPALESARDNIQEVVVDFYQDAIVKAVAIATLKI